MIVLNVASNGIASLLLLGGRTTHSTVCFSLLINEESTCNMKQWSLKAKLLLQTKLIIWDETPMINRYCFEAFDRTLRDIMRSKNDDNVNRPFRGKLWSYGRFQKNITSCKKRIKARYYVSYYQFFRNLEFLQSLQTYKERATSIKSKSRWYKSICRLDNSNWRHGHQWKNKNIHPWRFTHFRMWIPFAFFSRVYLSQYITKCKHPHFFWRKNNPS